MTTITTSIIRPGLLVSLKTNVRGGVRYEKVTLDADHAVDERARMARWETTRRITDAEEYKAATTVRNKARWLVTAACCQSTFGLLCPQSKEDKLAEAIAEAQDLANKHNQTASHTRVEVFVITGRVADSDEQAARAIGSEVREIIDAMEAGVRNASPEAIRDAATKARGMAAMLSTDVQNKVSAAISEVRTIARDIVRRVEKSGESAASIVSGLKLERLTDARFSVLDLDGDGAVPDQLSIPLAGRSLELDASNDDDPQPPRAAGARAIDMSGA